MQRIRAGAIAAAAVSLVVLIGGTTPAVAVGATAMLFAIASPLVVCWMCATDGPEPRAH